MRFDVVHVFAVVYVVGIPWGEYFVMRRPLRVVFPLTIEDRSEMVSHPLTWIELFVRSAIALCCIVSSLAVAFVGFR